MITANTLAGGITGVLVIAFGIKRLAPGLVSLHPPICRRPDVAGRFVLSGAGDWPRAKHFIHYRPEGLWLRRKAKAAQQELVHEH
ncbi:hypothetical protein ACLB1S_00680 [Escherichia coli]